MLIRYDDLTEIRSFFNNAGKPTREDVVFYMLARGIATSIGCVKDAYELAVMHHEASQYVGWQRLIIRDDDGRHGAIRIGPKKQGNDGIITVPMKIVSSADPNVWNIEFGEARMTIDLNDRASMNEFYERASEEIAIRMFTAL